MKSILSKKHKWRFKEQNLISKIPPNSPYLCYDFDWYNVFSPSGIEAFLAKNNFKEWYTFCIGTPPLAGK